jgi:hypothetical protein
MVYMGPRRGLSGLQSTDDGSLRVRPFKIKTQIVTDFMIEVMIKTRNMTDVKIDVKIDMKTCGHGHTDKLAVRQMDVNETVQADN